LTGQDLTYTITVINQGPDAALSVVVDDPLPAGLIFVSCVASQGTCNGPPVGTGGTVSTALGTLAAGASATITILVHVTAVSGTLFNSATIRSASSDPNPSNNIPSAVIPIGPASIIPMLSPILLGALLLALAGAGIVLLRRR
jgi:uncharacterized repeat protein (TIGR01451 family)